MKKTKKIVYPALVKQEAKNLKKFATKEELEKLSFQRLDPQSKFACIYGQCAVNCNSERAIDLIQKCAVRLYHAGDGTPQESKKLNGKPTIAKLQSRLNDYEYKYFSPIEVFIDRKGNMENGVNKRLIKYLKGEIRTL